MSAPVISIAERKARREAEAMRNFMLGSSRPPAKRLTLAEIMGWPPMPPKDAA